MQPMTKPDIIGTQKLIFGNEVHLSVNNRDTGCERVRSRDYRSITYPNQKKVIAKRGADHMAIESRSSGGTGFGACIFTCRSYSGWMTQRYLRSCLSLAMRFVGEKSLTYQDQCEAVAGSKRKVR